MYRGFYLNLNRSEKRRASLMRHLQQVGAASRYERFEAVDGRAVAHAHDTRLMPGELGVWLSHERFLQAHVATDVHVHLIEDDVVLARDAVRKLDAVLAQADAQLGAWDVLFTEIHVTVNLDIFRIFFEEMKAQAQLKGYTLVDLEPIPFAGATSLLFNRRSLGKCLRLIEGKWKEGVALDLYLQDLVRKGLLKAFVTLPFVTSLGPENRASDIRSNWSRADRVCELVRRAFFEEADYPSLLGEMRGLVKGIDLTPLAALYLQAEAFFLSAQGAAT